MINEYSGGGEELANDNVEAGNDNAGADATDWGAGGGAPNEAGATEVGAESIGDGLEEREDDSLEDEAASSDFVPPRAANDDVAGTERDPGEGTPVIGRRDDTQVASDWEGHAVIDLRANPNANEVWDEAHQRGDLRPQDGRPVTEVGWSPELNENWIGSIVEDRAIVYLGSEPAGDNLRGDDRKYASVFSVEIDQLQDAGYRRVGDYLVPGGLEEDFANRNRPPGDEE